MLKREFLILTFLCILSSCGLKKQKAKPSSFQKDAYTSAPAVEPAPQEEPGLVGSFLKKIKDYRTSHVTKNTKNYQELREQLKKCQERGDLDTALKYAEKMYAQCEDEQELIDLLLLCADLCVSQKNYKKASTLYNEFIRLYPRVPEKSAYAWYRAIICSENQQTDSNDRDQTVTHETITLAESYLKQGELFGIYKKEVTDILDRSKLRIIEHELSIVRFYLHRGNIKAAEKRIANIRTDWISRCTNAEPLIIIHEYLVAQASQKTDLMQQKITELNSRFSTYLNPKTLKKLPYTKPLFDSGILALAASNAKTPSSFVNRF